MLNIVKRLFGSRNERVLRKLYKIVSRINLLESEIQALSDTELSAKTEQFKQRLVGGETLDDLLPESFAVVREVSVRLLNLRHFDVQMIGGMVLHNGNIAEMLTGEGKTLAATLPAYLNALKGNSVHIITVNDYLAQRDAAWMSPIYEFLGMTVGVNIPNMSQEDKQKAYQANIIYGTNNEFGFDYLRDNMAFSLAERAQQDLSFAIVDEVDSILIDEARTPLIISGAAEDSSQLYIKINALVPSLKKQLGENGPGDYTLDEKSRQAFLTEAGHANIEAALVKENLLTPGESLYDAHNIILMHHIYAALRAHTLFHRDVEYIVRNDEVIIVDEHTGRLMPGRRWSDGLHQAVEAKEGVNIQNENQTLASITFQNYFRLYDKLSGMTGTADTEAYEFQQIYGLEVVVIPSNQQVMRKDNSDKVYMTAKEKFNAIVAEIKSCRERQQPVLVGTASIENSELIMQLLQKEKIPCELLNAKQHAREAQIIAQAGQPGAVTIATNMAGRGTDIVLGGNVDAEIKALKEPSEEKIKALRDAWQKRHDIVIAAGGLHVLGTERHESRRIDNQLRGRSGRQGDPGSSRFYLALEDSLLRIFASERLTSMMQKLGVKDGEALESKMLSRVIENAQRKVEGHNFDIRKQLLEYDNVANEQRQVVYSQRSDIMRADDISETIQVMIDSVASHVVGAYIPSESFVEQWDQENLTHVLEKEFSIKVDINQWLQDDANLTAETVLQRIKDSLHSTYKQKEQEIGAAEMRNLEKTILLHSLDLFWKEHLATMDYLRQGIHLRGYAQKNPKQEYKRESFDLFSNFLKTIQRETIGVICRIQVNAAEALMQAEQKRSQAVPQPMTYHHGMQNISQEEKKVSDNRAIPMRRNGKKVGRNDPCPCGSGKKFKHCHGQL